MIKSKKVVVTMGVAALTLMVGLGAQALEKQSPASVLSDITGKSIESLYEVKGDSTFGQIALENEVLDEFKAAVLPIKQERLDQQVSEGRLTAEKADEIYSRLLSNSEECDGSGVSKGDQKLSLGFGSGKGNGNGNQTGNGEGNGVQKQMGKNQRIEK